MATKDWEKQKSTDNQISWFHKDNDGYITVTNRFQHTDYVSKWKIYIEDENGKSIGNSKNAKTKSDALKHARAYMRKH